MHVYSSGIYYSLETKNQNIYLRAGLAKIFGRSTIANATSHYTQPMLSKRRIRVKTALYNVSTGVAKMRVKTISNCFRDSCSGFEFNVNFFLD